MMQFIKQIVATLVLGLLVAAGYFTRSHWLPWVTPAAKETAPHEDAGHTPTETVLLTDQAISNLGLKAQTLKTTSYWKTLIIPGMIVDLPGQSDRGVVAPVMGVVQKIHHLPGEVVKPGQSLFTLRLVSETLHQTQSELFKTQQNLKLAQAQLDRYKQAGNAIPEVRLIDINQQIARLEVSAIALRQELLTRGFSAEQLTTVAEGKFVQDMEVVVPPFHLSRAVQPAMKDGQVDDLHYEIQELKVELGQQVQPGQMLCTLANHHFLIIEGRAFRDETPFLERAVREGWPVEVDFQEPPGADWPVSKQTFHIQHLASTIDPVNRTFAFRMPLANESRAVTQGTNKQTLWRFRPGQKVRLHVPIEKLENVWVVPREAIVREGVETFVFTQNVNTFLRRPVKFLFLDRQQAILAADDTIAPGIFVAQSAAAQLNRMLKSQSSGVPPGYHMHADGTMHKNGED